MQLVFVGLFVVICAAVIQPTRSAMTMQQLKDAGKMARKSCQPKTGAATDKLDNMQVGKFDKEPDMKTKCYTKCIHTMMQVMKKGRYDPDKAIAQMSKVLPLEFRDKAKEGVNKCRNAGDGMTESCDISFAMVQCGFKLEPELFYFP